MILDSIFYLCELFLKKYFITVNGTTGEGPSLSTAERKKVAEAWAAVVKKTKQHLMVQIGGAALNDVKELVSIFYKKLK